MRSFNQQPNRGRVGLAVTAAAAVAFVLFAFNPATLAQSGADRWVGTWTTAEVGRPQNPPPLAQPLPPFMMNTRCPAGTPGVPQATPPPVQTFAPPPYTHFTNQTLRQIVHTS